MNYRKLYMNIIANAKSQNRKKLKRDDPNYVYYEAHHILPKSLFPNWKNKKYNIVLLTAKEHFFCHELLAEIYKSSKMFFALFRMCYDGKRKVTPREFERIRIKCIDSLKDIRANLSDKEKEELYNKVGKSVSLAWENKTDEQKEEFKNKMKKVNKEVWENKTDEQKEKHRQNTKIGMQKMSEEKIKLRAKKLSEAATGKYEKFSEEKKEEIRNKKINAWLSKDALERELINKKKNVAVGTTWFNNGVVNVRRKECPEGFVKGKIKNDRKGN